MDRWCLVLDADEFLVYPRMHDVSLSALIEYLEISGHDALPCKLLDMFPKCNILETKYQRGQDLFAVAPYFDRTLSTRKKAFKVEPFLQKMPLFRFSEGRILGKGQHVVVGAHSSNISGCLLHFRFLQNFGSKIHSNILLRLQDVEYGRELKAYKATIEQDPALTLYSSESVRYESPDQLVELGLMHSCAAFEDFSSAVARKASG